jgi:hypothetical protein
MNDYFKGIPAPVGLSLNSLAISKSLNHAGAMGGMELLQNLCHYLRVKSKIL